jgi:hypothetical protein
MTGELEFDSRWGLGTFDSSPTFEPGSTISTIRLDISDISLERSACVIRLKVVPE